MSHSIREDALSIRKLIREAESVSDEVIIACARLKQALVQARQNPAVPIDTGQRAILRLTQAEQHALTMSTSLLRVHDELSRIAREFAADDSGEPTIITPMALGSIYDGAALEPA